MTKSKKLSIFILGLFLVLASCIFAACGKVDYSKTYLTSQSGEYIELYADEEKELAITIQNPVSDMNRGLIFSQSNPNVANIKQIAVQNNTTTYSIKGVSGGRTNVEFMTIEGRKSLTVTIFVKEYSDLLQRADNSLYVTKTKELAPTSTDFKFKDSATERALDFYFYGKCTAQDKLTFEDISSNNGYINSFVSVKLYSANDKNYLIFTDKEGGLHTLGKSTKVVGTNNERFEFIAAEQIEFGYDFDFENVSAVEAGDKFTFVAVYNNDKLQEEGGNSEILCEREFSILEDIVEEDFSHEYGYKINEIDFVAGGQNVSYKIDDLKNGVITLIPNYTTVIKDSAFLNGYTANYLTVYLEVSVKSNNLLKYKFKTRDNFIANSKIIDTLNDGENTIYYLEINCGNGSANSTFFDLNFYYEGFENSKDSNVNFTYSIPVEVRVIPVTLLINNVDFAEIEKVYKFYNSYASVDSGWQEFNFTVIPEGAEYDNLVIDLTDSDLQIKYMNVVYTTGLVSIKNLKEPVYIKGGERAELTTTVKNLPVSMDFNIIEEDSLKTDIQYEIVRGATYLRYTDEEYKSAVYLERNDKEVLFDKLYADAEFSNATFTLESGKDVVKFEFKDDLYDVEGFNYYLNLYMTPRDTGSGTYTVTLDNGVQTTITIDVREALKTLSVATSNEDNSIKLKEDNENYSLIYMLNRTGNNYFDLRFIANDNRNSNAITMIDLDVDSASISVSAGANDSYLIYSSQCGRYNIIFTVQGYAIEDFKRSSTSIEYTIELVTYELANDIYVYKVSDGLNNQYPSNTSANYVNVYTNTHSSELREAKLEVSLANTEAYLFKAPSSNKYVPAKFSQEYIYFESDEIISKDNRELKNMYYSATQSNIYTVGTFGTFDTERLVFTAYPTNSNGGRIRLIAHVMQYSQLYSFVIYINILPYKEVERITLQESTTELQFSIFEPQQSVIAYPTNADATNGEIVALISGGVVMAGEGDDKTTYQMFPEGSISYIVSNGKTQVTFKVDEKFIAAVQTYQEEMVAEISIVAKDWLDVSGNLRSGYSEFVKPIKAKFANGTRKNRFLIKNTDDLLAIKDNLSAHYEIKSTIDASTISNLLPLGELKGSIIGLNEYSGISGIEISKAYNNQSHYGLFSSIAEGAYIEYVQFEGSFNISTIDQAYIGLVAGENKGRLINVGVVITSSNVDIGGATSFFGGLVGRNTEGEIIQDFTLFESDDSNTRTTKQADYDNIKTDASGNVISIGKDYGRISYAGMTPRITVMMNDFVDIKYVVNSNSKYIGGLVGENTGIIRKVDSNKMSFTGYSNYMAFSKIKTNYENEVTQVTNLNIYTGGLVGSSSGLQSQIVGGYNSVLNNTVEFNPYLAYKTEDENETEENFDYEAGKGLLVGGEVWSYGYVSGVVGKISDVSDASKFSGITVRTFVRGLNKGMVAEVSLFAFVAERVNLTNSFAVQAVDDGKINEESSMLVLYNNSNPYPSLNNDFDKNDIINLLGFGNASHGISSLNIDAPNIAVNAFSYLSRNYLEIEYENEDDGYGTTIVNKKPLYVNTNKTAYYGDFIIVAEDNNRKIVHEQMKFAKGDLKYLSVEENFNNKMLSKTGKGNKDIYYAYYFEVASVIDNDMSTLQMAIDPVLNRVSTTSKLYPIKINGEMTFTSLSKDILDVDSMGKFTIKKTGLALLTASSVLNTNEALSFYIYVVNYFDSESMIAEEDKHSIVYPAASASSVPVDKTTVELRGNNSASLYVLPRYTFAEDKTLSFSSNDKGASYFGGVYFYLAANTEVTADVSIIVEKQTIDGVEKPIYFYDELGNPASFDKDGNPIESSLEINVIGQTITIRRLDNSVQGYYKLRIVPMLKVTQDDDVYFAQTNRVLDNAEVDYKYGALEIKNKNYNNVPIQTSKTIIEEITIISTDENEANPYVHILGLENQALQGDLKGQEYQLTSDEEKLFNVSITKTSTKTYDNGTYEIKYNLEISINRDAQIYKDRYNNEIYGIYTLNLQTRSNSSKMRTIFIDFERTGVSSIVVDNYTSLDQLNKSMTLSSSSDLAYPGQSGLLSFTINPEDSDFDYILIENDDANYESGHSLAAFSLVARYQNEVAENNKKLFEEGMIAGSIVSKGLKLTLEELVSVYGESGKNDKKGFNPYNGVVYIKYDTSSSNVIDLSNCRINISAYKDGEVIYSAGKNLTIKLQNYVAVEIDGKEGISNQNGYYMTYKVARGLKYKLNINSYGFKHDAINIVSNSSLGKISYENGSWYLTITDANIDYPNNEFVLTTSASQQDGETVRNAESQTRIIVYEYVVNYNNDRDKNSDIVKGMGDGIINIQVGTQITFAVDLYSFIEYSSAITGVGNKIEEFMRSLERYGKWNTITNLITDDQPDYKMAGSTTEERQQYLLGYEANGQNKQHSNYYFNSDGLSVIPKRTHAPEEKFYYFTFEGYYNVNSGIYTAENYIEGAAQEKIETQFVMNVYSTSSAESPIPIYTYSDFIKMQQGGYYILLNDITLPSTSDEEGGVKAFTPIVGDFASFDGNGHAINFAGTYDMGSLSEIGIFSTIETGSIVKNLIVNYTSANDGSDENTDPNDSVYGLFGLKTVKFVTTSESFMFGTIAAQNAGIISNCQVISNTVAGNKYYLTIKADNALTGSSYAGGLVGGNSGYITNCGVSLNAKMPYNLAGVVAQNNRKVAGCYFKEGNLINNSQYDQHIAGFAISNSNDAQIMTSFVSGGQSSASLYSKDNNSSIVSTLAGGGFIYSNEGTIKDCYTDIDLSKTLSEMAGFAYRNSGKIRNCFSLSVLRSNTTASAGFARAEIIDGVKGVFENCYYFYNIMVSDENKNEEMLAQGHYGYGHSDNKNINVSLYAVEYKGVERLTQGQFANVEKYFSHYSYDENLSTKSVWFFSRGHQSNQYVEYIPTTEKIILPGDDGNDQSNTVYRQEVITFGLNRLALVSPNVRVLSIRNFAYSEIDEATGNVTYFYLDDAQAPDRGSLHNPRLITDANTMEAEILNQTASNYINTTNYRILCDISYAEFEGHSNLYKVIYAGNLEGNGMEISNIGLVYMDSRTNGGMFSQIGYAANKTGSVKNLIIKPREVVFNNTNNVGTLAGTLKYGFIYDIKVDAEPYNLASVSGLNFVGGIVGRAVSSFEIKDVYSNANVWAVYSPINDYTYTESAGQESSYSYAGGIVGFAGNGKIFNSHVDSIQTIVGSRTGLAFGGLGQGAKVEYTFVDVEPGFRMRSNHYAGYVAGEVAGYLGHAYVSNNKAIESSFSSVPKAAVGVGGIAGKLCGGTIENSQIEQSFRISNAENETAIENVGGLVGTVIGASGVISTIKDCVVNADFASSSILGGAVGGVSTALVIDSVAVKSKTLTISGKRENPCLGGIVAKIRNTDFAALEMINSYCQADLNITTFTTGIASTASVGGLIGMCEGEKIPTLSYCYTTSKIKAEVYDSRALGANVDFGSIEDNDKINFTYNITSNNNQNNNFERVYFLGGSQSTSDSGASSNVIYKGLSKNLVEFTSRAKALPIQLSVNNFGKSSVGYMQELSSTDISSGLNLKSLQGLYGNKYQINNAITLDGSQTSANNFAADESIFYNVLNKTYSTYYMLNSQTKAAAVFVKNPDTHNEYIFTEINGSGATQTQTQYTLDETKLCCNTLFRGSDGEYYRQGINSGEKGYTRLADGKFVEDSAIDVTLTEIWKTSNEAFSTLFIENSFTWTGQEYI